MPLYYDPDAGLIVRIDFVNKLPICYNYIKVSYGIFIKKYQNNYIIVLMNQKQLKQQNNMNVFKRMYLQINV